MATQYFAGILPFNVSPDKPLTVILVRKPIAFRKIKYFFTAYSPFVNFKEEFHESTGVFPIDLNTFMEVEKDGDRYEWYISFGYSYVTKKEFFADTTDYVMEMHVLNCIDQIADEMKVIFLAGLVMIASAFGEGISGTQAKKALRVIKNKPEYKDALKELFRLALMRKTPNSYQIIKSFL